MHRLMCCQRCAALVLHLVSCRAARTAPTCSRLGAPPEIERQRAQRRQVRQQGEERAGVVNLTATMQLQASQAAEPRPVPKLHVLKHPAHHACSHHLFGYRDLRAADQLQGRQVPNGMQSCDDQRMQTYISIALLASADNMTRFSMTTSTLHHCKSGGSRKGASGMQWCGCEVLLTACRGCGGVPKSPAPPVSKERYRARAPAA
jgi:hypothetical protein